jgi:hypothetical protein
MRVLSESGSSASISDPRPPELPSPSKGEGQVRGFRTSAASGPPELPEQFASRVLMGGHGEGAVRPPSQERGPMSS